MTKIRPPAVAGAFYPGNPVQLQSMIDYFLDEAEDDGQSNPPKAIIVPHAGYIYSGPVAASAYARLKKQADNITRVVLIGPSHRVAFAGLAVPSVDEFATPLGNIKIDTQTVTELSAMPFVHYLEQAHSMEHSLEVQLPFLQTVLKSFQLVPIVAGDASADQVRQVLEKVWGGPETLIVISSDLSHYHDYETAREMDSYTSRLIEAKQYENLDFDSACGRTPVSGLLAYARDHDLSVKTVDLRNSGDTAGDKNRVVGYGAYVIN